VATLLVVEKIVRQAENLSVPAVIAMKEKRHVKMLVNQKGSAKSGWAESGWVALEDKALKTLEVVIENLHQKWWRFFIT
jgi:hypothetical protein